MARLGFVLLHVVFWASNQHSRARVRPSDYVLAFAAHVSLAAVSVIGKVIDALPPKSDYRHRVRATKPVRV